MKITIKSMSSNKFLAISHNENGSVWYGWVDTPEDAYGFESEGDANEYLKGMKHGVVSFQSIQANGG